MNDLNIVIEKINNEFHPFSIFLYGSRSGTSHNLDSDYEIGLIFKENYVPLKTIKDFINDSKFSVFPFKYDEMLNYCIDTPFQKSIFINTLIESGKTLSGDKVIENLEKILITNQDLLMDVTFNLGYAMASVRCFKDENINLANELFYKSCLYATRDLIYKNISKLAVSYDEIYLMSKEINIPEEYKKIIQIAYDYRKNKINVVDEIIFYKNISYINKYIEMEILNKYN